MTTLLSSEQSIHVAVADLPEPGGLVVAIRKTCLLPGMKLLLAVSKACLPLGRHETCCFEEKGEEGALELVGQSVGPALSGLSCFNSMSRALSFQSSLPFQFAIAIAIAIALRVTAHNTHFHLKPLLLAYD